MIPRDAPAQTDTGFCGAGGTRSAAGPRVSRSPAACTCDSVLVFYDDCLNGTLVGSVLNAVLFRHGHNTSSGKCNAVLKFEDAWALVYADSTTRARILVYPHAHCRSSEHVYDATVSMPRQSGSRRLTPVVPRARPLCQHIRQTRRNVVPDGSPGKHDFRGPGVRARLVVEHP